MDDQERRARASGPDVSRPWYHRLRIIEWICLLVFVVPGSVLLVAALPEFWSRQEPAFWTNRVLITSSVVLLSICYILLVWFGYRAVGIGRDRKLNREAKARLLVAIVRPFWVFPALAIVVVSSTVKSLPRELVTVDALLVSLVVLPLSSVVIGVLGGSAVAFLRRIQ